MLDEINKKPNIKDKPIINSYYFPSGPKIGIQPVQPLTQNADPKFPGDSPIPSEYPHVFIKTLTDIPHREHNDLDSRSELDSHPHSSITNLTTDLANKADLIDGLIPTAELGTGIPNAGNFLRGDRIYASPPLIQPGGLEPVYYTIFNDSGIIKAVNGTTGQTDYYSTDA